MLSSLNNWRRIAYCTARLQKICGLKKFSTGITLVSTGTRVSAVRTSSLHEPVRQESVTLGTIKLLGFLGENVAVLVDFHQKVTHKLFVHRVFCASVVAESYAPPLEEVRHLCMVSVRELLWRDIQAYSFYFDGCSMFV